MRQHRKNRRKLRERQQRHPKSRIDPLYWYFDSHGIDIHDCHHLQVRNSRQDEIVFRNDPECQGFREYSEARTYHQARGSHDAPDPEQNKNTYFKWDGRDFKGYYDSYVGANKKMEACIATCNKLLDKIFTVLKRKTSLTDN